MIGSDCYVANQARRWGVGVGTVAGAATAAVVIAMTGAPVAKGSCDVVVGL